MNRSNWAAVALVATYAAGAAGVAFLAWRTPEAGSTPIETEPLGAPREEARADRVEAPARIADEARVEVAQPAEPASVPVLRRAAGVARVGIAAARAGAAETPFQANGKAGLGIAGFGDADLTAFADKAGPTVELTANEGDLEQALQRRVPMFRDCYEEALKNDDNLQGKLHMSFDIDSEGRVAQVGFSNDSLRRPELKKCIRRRAMDWRFEKPNDGPVRVVTALAFGARSVSVAVPPRSFSAAKILSVR